MEQTKVKICGLTRKEDIQVANALHLDYVGLVFAKSKRQVSPMLAYELRQQLHLEIPIVGVFVNANIEDIVRLIANGVIQVVQLHGDETEADIELLKSKSPETSIIKAIRVTCLEDILRWEKSKADYLLLDNGAGGTGEAFDWQVLSYLETFSKPYFIAGGLQLENVRQVLDYGAYGVDVSSGVETDGWKDKEKMTRFVKEVRR